EGAGGVDRGPVSAEDVDLPVVKVGGVELGSARPVRDREALVDRMVGRVVDGDQGGRRRRRRVPASNGPVLTRPDEEGGTGGGPAADDERRRQVRDHTR